MQPARAWRSLLRLESASRHGTHGSASRHGTHGSASRRGVHAMPSLVTSGVSTGSTNMTVRGGVLNAAEDEVEGAGLQQHREVFDAVIVGNEASFGPVHDMLPEDGV
eukprot:2842526-Prymnesium_polylepis.1